MIRILSLFLILVLASCMSLDDHMRSFVGKPVDSAIAAWGPPSSKTANEDGSATYYAWRGEAFCVKTFTVDRGGIIRGWVHFSCDLR